MEKLLCVLFILMSIFLNVGDCKVKMNDKNILGDISDDDEKCPKGKTFLDSSTGFLQSFMDRMFSSKKPADPKFLYFSLENDQEPRYVTNANFTSWDEDDTDFDPTIKTVFIIHGFKDTNAPWTRKLKDALILREHCNVFLVECGHSSDTYSDAFKNIPVVGIQVAAFIRSLMKSKGLDLRDVHLIGHSAGAQAAAFAAEVIKKTEEMPVGRISGLDPAGPGFYGSEADQRLDVTDAAFVDVIHTNKGCNRLEGMGYPDAMGHFDFYPNGGKSQPGCLTMSEYLGRMDFNLAKSSFNYLFGTLEQPELLNMTHLLCSHGMSHDLFTASILNEGCKFRAVQCSSWKRYESGQCDGQEEVVMGYYSDRFKDCAEDGTKKFYLETTANPPYCRE